MTQYCFLKLKDLSNEKIMGRLIATKTSHNILEFCLPERIFPFPKYQIH